MTTTYLFKAVFFLDGLPYAPSPAPTFTTVDTSNNKLVNAQAVTTLSNANGVCLYSYSGADGLDLIGRFDTTDTAPERQTLFDYTPSILTTNLNGTISGLGARLPAALTANGNMKSSLLEIISTALSEGATGRIAAAWQAFWNVTSPVATAQSVNQSANNDTKISTILADYARRTGDYATVAALSALQANVTTILTDYARRTGDYSVFAAGQQVDLINAPNATAITAIQSGLATPTNVWTRLTSALTTSGSIGKLIVDMLDAATSTRATPADVAVSIAVTGTTIPTVPSGSVSVIAGDTFRASYTSTYAGDLGAATELWFVLKYQRSVTDALGYFLITKTGGLTVVNSAAYATPGHGSIVVTGLAGAWVITLYIDEIATALLRGTNNRNVLAGIKAKVGADDVTLVDDGIAPGYIAGTSRITDGLVQAVS